MFYLMEKAKRLAPFLKILTQLLILPRKSTILTILSHLTGLTRKEFQILMPRRFGQYCIVRTLLTIDKPEDWDEDAPYEIPDLDAAKPEGWLDDEPLTVPDPG